jgi:hypothetical protein
MNAFILGRKRGKKEWTIIAGPITRGSEFRQLRDEFKNFKRKPVNADFDRVELFTGPDKYQDLESPEQVKAKAKAAAAKAKADSETKAKADADAKAKAAPEKSEPKEENPPAK